MMLKEDKLEENDWEFCVMVPAKAPEAAVSAFLTSVLAVAADDELATTASNTDCKLPDNEPEMLPMVDWNKARDWLVSDKPASNVDTSASNVDTSASKLNTPVANDADVIPSEDFTSAMLAVAKVNAAASDDDVLPSADCTAAMLAVASVKEEANEEEALTTLEASELDVCEMNVLVSPSEMPNEEELAATVMSVPASEAETEST